eukprot:Skav219764  [mRNA]  locus=scaffold3128:6742:8145:- [translate_table: standard]
MLTVKQVKSFFKCMGFKLKQGSHKQKFLEFALKEWDTTVAHGMTIDRNYNTTVEGSPKLLMFKRENSYYMPFMVHAGQVFYEKFFDDMKCEQLTIGMLKSLTVEELLDLRVKLGGISYFDKSDGKKEITQRMLRAWEFNLERFDDNKEEGDDTNSITMMPEDELSDASSDISADEFVMNSMYDYLGLDEEKVSNEMRFYIQSAADFYDKPVNVEVCSAMGDKPLMSVVVDEGKFTVDDIKDEIINRINHFSKDENRLTADDFVLSDGIHVLTGTHHHQPHQTKLYMLLRLRGGGKGVQKKNKEKKLQLAEKLKKDIAETGKNIKNDHLKNLPPVKDIEKKILEMLALREQNPETALKKLAESCNNIEKLNECIALLDRNDKSIQVCNTVEGRLKRLSRVIYGEAGEEIFKMKEQIDHIADAMNSTVQYLFMKTSSSSDRYDISDLRTMLISVRSFLEGKSAASDDML